MYILSWIPVGIINLAFLIVGWPIVGYFSRKPMSEWPRWTWIWQNDGDAKDIKLGAAGGDHDVPRWYLKKFYDGKPWLSLRLGENMGGFDPDTLFVFARYSMRVRRFKYMALRNPVNNHRFIFDDVESFNTLGDPEAFDTESADLERRGLRSASGWRYAGFFAGYRRIWLTGRGKYSEFYIGWKVGSRVPGFGFTLQIRLNRDDA